MSYKNWAWIVRKLPGLNSCLPILLRDNLHQQSPQVSSEHPHRLPPQEAFSVLNPQQEVLHNLPSLPLLLRPCLEHSPHLSKFSLSNLKPHTYCRIPLMVVFLLSLYQEINRLSKMPQSTWRRRTSWLTLAAVRICLDAVFTTRSTLPWQPSKRSIYPLLCRNSTSSNKR